MMCVFRLQKTIEYHTVFNCMYQLISPNNSDKADQKRGKVSR